MKTAEPTEHDVQTLVRALQLERRFKAGIFPRTGGDVSHFHKLERFGVLEFTGEYGRDLDAVVGRDVPIYQLTPEGRAWIERREAESPPPIAAGND